MDFKPLDHYFTHLMSQPFGNLLPALMGIKQYGPMLSIVLDRQGQFQAEMFLVPEGVDLLEFHNHPNVDTYELYITGDFIFESNGVQYQSSLELERLNKRNIVWVPSEHIHGALFKTPGAFISFQYWKNGVAPTSVGEDFEVDHKNENHLKGLKGLDRLDKPVILENK